MILNCKNLKKEDIEVFENVSLKNFTTFRIGGVAKYFVKIYSEKGLNHFLKFSYDEGIPYFILGGGSNILVRDSEINDMLIVKLDGEFRKIELKYGNRVFVGSSYSLPSFAKFAFDHSLGGAEFCVAIPGSVGGGVIMNAGAHGCEIKDIVKRVFCFAKDGRSLELSREEAGFSYRNSNLKDYIITFVEFELNEGSRDKIKEIMEENLRYRANTQPKGFSAGSVFKNPPSDKAWKLIRKVGLAGFKIGDVMFSEKHANFIINLGNGLAEDVLNLIKIARKRVFETFGILLEPEIKFLGLSLE